MTERGAGHVVRDASSLRIGPSSLSWDGHSLTIAIDEITAPWPRRVRGTIRVTPSALHGERFALDAAGLHHWSPIAPCARVDVDLAQPRHRWRGHAYLDSNAGAVPLERDFVRWHWSRARTEDGGTAVLYDIARRDGSDRSLALRFHPDSDRAVPFDAPPLAALPASRWRVRRETRSDAGSAARIASSMEDGPFYARSVVGSHLFGRPATAVHESLDLDRFASPWVQAMLPFRMPRRG